MERILGMQGSQPAKEVVKAMVAGSFDEERDFKSKIKNWNYIIYGFTIFAFCDIFYFTAFYMICCCEVDFKKCKRKS